MRLADVKLGQADTSARQAGHGPVQVIAVTGGKGGTGKTNISVNLAYALARVGRRTMLLDADLGMANVDVLLGLTPARTLFDVVSGTCQIEDIIMTVDDELMVVPAASGAHQLASLGCRECAGLVRAFSDLERPLDTLVVDTATGISACVASFCRAANEIIVVVCNEPASIHDSVARIEMLSAEFGINRFRILANMVNSARDGRALFSRVLAEFSDDHAQVLSYAGFVPRDECLVEALNARTSVVSAFPRSRSAMALLNLARQVMSWPQPAQAGGHVEFFVERLIQNENSGMEVTS
ncbi:MAG: P-loop NTPase [Gammaproteobacteria bacterium]|nr:P-loop NTPase [Gammaproteobacteria bacterium]